MPKLLSYPVIALEEHYLDEELASCFTPPDIIRVGPIRDSLLDLDGGRLAAMDAAGIDIQVLSHAPPATQKLSQDIAGTLSRRVNDRLAQAIARHPTRFAGFAALPTADSNVAADELERCVREHGFKGAVIHGLANGAFIDQPRFWPIFARAEALDVPIYVHPSVPHSAVVDAYYADYSASFPMFPRAAWGYTVESATQAIRLVLSGVFEAHPGLKIILGHFGEGLPYMLWRINDALSRPGHKAIHFKETFQRNFWLTTSGFFSNTALLASMLEIGIDRVTFSVDYPFVSNEAGVHWLAATPLSEEDRAKLAGGNAQRLLRL